MSDTNGLSREQVETLASALVKARLSMQAADWALDSLVPTVAAMLAEARAEGERTSGEDECLCDAPDYGVNGVWCSLHPNPGSAAAGAPLRASEGGAGVGGPGEAKGASDGRTGPYDDPRPCRACGHTGGPHIASLCRLCGCKRYVPDSTTCDERLGDMRCQLKRGHDGDHEDWTGV